MVNHEIVEGLRLALSRGYSLENAMMSFYNAGYMKNDIEEAARELYKHPSISLSHPEKKTPEELKKPVETFKALPASDISQAVTKTEKREEKKIGVVSTYEDHPKSKKSKLIIILLIILLILLGIGIVGFILFRDTLISFFSNLF